MLKKFFCTLAAVMLSFIGLTLIAATPQTNPNLKGWPSYIAMGQVIPNTDQQDANELLAGTATTPTPANIICKFDLINHYTDGGGPIQYSQNSQGEYVLNEMSMQTTLSLVDNANYITTTQNMACKPVLTVYTAAGSGGTASVVSLNNPQDMAKNLAYLALNAYILNGGYGENAINGYNGGTIILNPDLLSFINQIGQSTFNSEVINPSQPFVSVDPYTVNYALGFVNFYMNTYKNPALEMFYTWSPNPEWLMTPSNNTLEQNISYVYSYWASQSATYNISTSLTNIVNNSFDSAWAQFTADYPNADSYKFTNSENITFTDDLSGWIEANNFIVRTYGPNVPFGWDCGIYQNKNVIPNEYEGSVDWVDFAPGSSEVSALLNNSSQFYSITNLPLTNVSNQMLSSDFLVADIGVYMPLADETSFNNGWLFNANAYRNWFSFLTNLHTSYNLPIMLYQVSGAALPTSANNVTLFNSSTPYNTLANYIFGNYDLNSGTPNLSSSAFTATVMPNTYFTSTGDSLLSFLQEGFENSTVTSNYNWSMQNLNTLQNAGVFAICWGGSAGSWYMPGVSPYFPLSVTSWTSDNGWLNDNVNAYRAANS